MKHLQYLTIDWVYGDVKNGQLRLTDKKKGESGAVTALIFIEPKLFSGTKNDNLGSFSLSAFSGTLCSRYCYFPHLTDEEIQTQK